MLAPEENFYNTSVCMTLILEKSVLFISAPLRQTTAPGTEEVLDKN